MMEQYQEMRVCAKSVKNAESEVSRDKQEIEAKTASDAKRVWIASDSYEMQRRLQGATF